MDTGRQLNQCYSCKEYKPVDKFHVRKTGKLYSYCNECENVKSKESYYRNRETKLLSIRRVKLRMRYGITPEEYEKRLVEQAGRCAICKQEPSKQRLAVDHCHKTGRIRGLLCSSCNHGLGNFKDSPNLLDKAIKYIDYLS